MANGRKGEVYLITNDRSEPFDRIYAILKTALNVRVPAIYVPEWAALAATGMVEALFSKLGKAPPVTRKNIESTLADRVFSIAKAKKDLGFTPEVDVKKGLTDTVIWYKEKGWL